MSLRRARFAGDPLAFAAGGGDAAVQRGRELERDPRVGAPHRPRSSDASCRPSSPRNLAKSGSLAEVAVDRGVTDVRHLIERLQRLHHHLADHCGRDFGFAHALELAHDLGDHAARRGPDRSDVCAWRWRSNGRASRDRTGMRRPDRLSTVSSRSCTRSKVVKRPPQAGQNRRRRIAAPSSDGRESLTWLSTFAQNGQRMIVASSMGSPISHVDRKPRRSSPATSRADLRLDAPPWPPRPGPPGSRLRRRSDGRSAGIRFLAEAAGGPGRRAQPDARGDGRRGLSSKGTPFLLQVMLACSSAISAALPVTPLGRMSTSMTWLSVPPETMASPRSTRTAASARALSMVCRA